MPGIEPAKVLVEPKTGRTSCRPIVREQQSHENMAELQLHETMDKPQSSHENTGELEPHKNMVEYSEHSIMANLGPSIAQQNQCIPSDKGRTQAIG